MAVHLTALLLFSGLTGLDSVETVGRVSVQAGQSVSIPCLYSSQYKGHVKYLCKGSEWRSCTYEARTDNHQNSGRYLISDDKGQGIFTVIIRQLTDKDNYYWCNVEINHGADSGKRFHLAVTAGTPTLWVDNQEVAGFIGESVSIRCHHSNSGKGKWCRLGKNCATTSSEMIDSMKVIINSTVPNVFTVTMTDLRPDSSGWYWCALGDDQMPVHLTVKEKPATTTSVIGASAVTSLHKEEDRPTGVDLQSVAISLSVLIAIAIVTLIVWLLLRHRKKKTEESATSKMENEVTYCVVNHKGKPSDQTEDVVTCSSVVHAKQNSAEVEGTEDKVIYSIVSKRHHNIH